MRRTIYPEAMRPVEPDAPEFAKRLNEAVRKMIVADTFDDRFEDRGFAVRRFKRHIDDVRDSIDASRLLVFDVRDGWAPLCDLLGVPIPDEPFPRLNESGQFPAPQGDARGAAWPPNPGPAIPGFGPRPGPPPRRQDSPGPFPEPRPPGPFPEPRPPGSESDEYI
jgi:hypothetical protein